MAARHQTMGRCLSYGWVGGQLKLNLCNHQSLIIYDQSSVSWAIIYQPSSIIVHHQSLLISTIINEQLSIINIQSIWLLSIVVNYHQSRLSASIIISVNHGIYDWTMGSPSSYICMKMQCYHTMFRHIVTMQHLHQCNMLVFNQHQQYKCYIKAMFW